MNILLDTCSFLWIISGSGELSTTAREAFADPGNEVFLSAASCWEISVKWSLGKLRLPEDPARFLPKQRSQHFIEPLPIAEQAVFHLAKLPHHHKDPFDLILICQAIEHSLVLLTPDPLITQYPVRAAW
ncbi:MAG: type II toxin-antitoxin system VapC family toxin [Desulfurivibrio sp.]|nr:MAG: type II toxin-antitoxin system VapC family toxin [Desulfurivibrio sp.]